MRAAADLKPPEPAESSVRRLGRLLTGVAEGWVPPAASSAVPAEPARAADAAEPSHGVAGVRVPLRWAPTPQALMWLLAAGLAVLLAAGLLLSHHHGSAPPSATSPISSAGPLPAPAVAQIVVDVGGRVRRPGLVTLTPGARVADAVAAAGGALRRSDLATVNLAGKVGDGQMLVIGGPGGAPAGTAGSTGGAAGGSGGPVDLNSATAEQLDSLPGVGPVLAQRIVSWREQHGGFASVDQLQQVAGIGERKFADLKDLVTA